MLGSFKFPEEKLSKNQMRVLYLKEIGARKDCPWDELARRTIKGVITAYESGSLNLEKQLPGQVAVFWGPSLKRKWGDMNEIVKNGPDIWKRKDPTNALWIEDVSFQMLNLQLFLCLCIFRLLGHVHLRGLFPISAAIMVDSPTTRQQR